MMKLTAVAAAGFLTLAVQGTAHAQMPGLAGGQVVKAEQALVHKTGRRGRRIAAGFVLGALSATAIAHGSRHYYDDRDDWRHERRCRRWMYRCEDGHAAPAGNSTGAADRVSQPVEPTVRVLLQHGRSSLGTSKPEPSENDDLKRQRANAYLYRGIVVGWVSLPQEPALSPCRGSTHLPSGRVVDGGVTPSAGSLMMGTTVWHTCINKR